MAEIISLSNVSNVEQAINFYTKSLNFHVVESSQNRDGSIAYATLARGKQQIMFAKTDDYVGSPICDLPQSNTEVYMIIEDDYLAENSS